jgi:hypothetical protein
LHHAFGRRCRRASSGCFRRDHRRVQRSGSCGGVGLAHFLARNALSHGTNRWACELKPIDVASFFGLCEHGTSRCFGRVSRSKDLCAEKFFRQTAESQNLISHTYSSLSGVEGVVRDTIIRRHVHATSS